jgi:hypothetical protein
VSPDALKDYLRIGFMGVAVGGIKAAIASYFFTVFFAVPVGLEKSMSPDGFERLPLSLQVGHPHYNHDIGSYL